MPDTPQPSGIVDWLNELVLGAGIACATAGAWHWLGAGALILPGIVLLWLGLPTRRTFIHHPPAARPPITIRKQPKVIHPPSTTHPEELL